MKLRASLSLLLLVVLACAGQAPGKAEQASLAAADPACGIGAVCRFLPLVGHNSAASPPPGLAAVNDFLYQLQNLNLTAIGNTAYDLVVMDYSADGDDETAI